MTATVGPSQEMQINTPGSAVFAPIFSALQTLQTDITSGSGTKISSDLTGIDTANDNLSQVRANIGSNVNQLSDINSRLGTVTGDLQNQLSSVQNADIAQVYTQLQTDQNVYQASLEATAESFKYSLADYITSS